MSCVPISRLWQTDTAHRAQRDAREIKGDTGISLPEGVSVILAPNPPSMTLQGTNTYIVAGSEGCVVIDPGPEIESHQAAVAEAMGCVHQLCSSDCPLPSL